MANRIRDILLEKEYLGMGEGRMRKHIGYTEGYGDGFGTRKGALKGWKTRRHNNLHGKVVKEVIKKEKKPNKWIKFVKKYSNEKGIPYYEVLKNKKILNEVRRKYYEKYGTPLIPRKARGDVKIPRRKPRKPKVTHCPPDRRLVKIESNLVTKRGYARTPYFKCLKPKKGKLLYS